MLKLDDTCSGLSVDDLARRGSSTPTPSATTTRDDTGALGIAIGGGKHVFVYGKDNHEPATYTVLRTSRQTTSTPLSPH